MKLDNTPTYGFPDTIKINDRTVPVSFFRFRDNMMEFWEWGRDINGRMCRVAHHAVPEHLHTEKKWKVKTSGNTYER